MANVAKVTPLAMDEAVSDEDPNDTLTLPGSTIVAARMEPTGVSLGGMTLMRTSDPLSMVCGMEMSIGVS